MSVNNSIVNIFQEKCPKVKEHKSSKTSDLINDISPHVELYPKASTLDMQTHAYSIMKETIRLMLYNASDVL